MTIATGSSLNAERRQRDLDALAGGEVVDVLVIGGGITGVGVALDAATRGLSVALVERRDLAHGTSRWSSKLIHGGLRYLAQGQLGIAYESARERDVLIRRTAPHLVRRLGWIGAFTPDLSRTTATLGRLGWAAADVLRKLSGTPAALLPRARYIGPEEVRAAVPAIAAKGLRGGVSYTDGQVEDDARLVVTVARTAAAYGARILTYCAAESIDGSGAHVRDERTGATIDIRARHVVNATGVWADTLADNIHLTPSKGAHVVLRSSTLGSPHVGFTIPVVGERFRFVFAVPIADDRVIVGLTDDPVSAPIPEVPTADDGDVTFLLSTLSRCLERPLTESDVIGSYAGLRPLLAGESGSTADLSRRHSVVVGGDQVITVVGGKLTTYRQMAEDTVDLLAGRPGVTAGPCRTKDIPLVGAASPPALAAVHAPERMVRKYGAEAVAVIALADGDPSLLDPIAPTVPTTRAELMFGLRHEGALDADDLLDRRTRIGLVPADRALAEPAASEVATAHGPKPIATG
ncbi:MAG: glycerol-3-phosphate dehydrogenase [Frankiales bacterium]|jgi:glycerol-3-phosphate dehydrogenase|nr:glycerol-3-phosphate dehydrogenase [Frankiales bacterium]